MVVWFEGTAVVVGGSSVVVALGLSVVVEFESSFGVVGGVPKTKKRTKLL